MENQKAKKKCEIDLDLFFKYDERTISVSKQTERFIKLYLATCDLATSISNALESVYDSGIVDEIYEESGVEEGISMVLAGLRKYIGESITEQMGNMENVTDKHINI